MGAVNTPVPDPVEVQKANQRREALLDAQRKANRDQPRNFKEDALDEKVVKIEPDGTGPSPTESVDADADRAAGSGSGPP